MIKTRLDQMINKAKRVLLRILLLSVHVAGQDGSHELCHHFQGRPPRLIRPLYEIHIGTQQTIFLAGIFLLEFFLRIALATRLHLTKLLMGFIRNAKLVERYRVHEALHHRVEEAGVAPVLHWTSHSLANLEHVGPFEQFYDCGGARLLNFTFEICFIFFPLFSFCF